MKKLTASIVAGALMISAMGINAFAAETAPKITVFGTENKPVTANEEVNIDVRMSSFDAVKGMDIILAGDSNVKLTGIATKGYTEGENYNVKDNKVHIVDLNSEKKTVNLKVTAVAAGNGEITVETAKLAKSGKELFADENVKTVAGKIKVATKPAATEGTKDLEAGKGYFIPAGGVYTQNGNEYVWYEKDENGIFKGVPAGASYQEFEIPDNNITTFAESESIKGKNPQFGTYALNVQGKTCGTMSIIGDWEKFVDYYRENNGRTVAQLVKSVSDYYDSVRNQIDDTTYTHAILKWNDGTSENTLKVYKKDQVNWMWKDGTNLQYALRVNGLATDDICTAVGYVVDGSTVTFSTTVKTAVKAEG